MCCEMLLRTITNSLVSKSINTVNRAALSFLGFNVIFAFEETHSVVEQTFLPSPSYFRFALTQNANYAISFTAILSQIKALNLKHEGNVRGGL